MQGYAVISLRTPSKSSNCMGSYRGEGIPRLLPIFCATIPAIYKRLQMLSTALWVTALALESALLLRAFRGKFLKHYRIFYLYLGWVLVSDLSLVPFYYLLPKIYGY